MSKDVAAAERSVSDALGGHADVREIVRLLQCSQCSRPFRSPVTLPCGNTLCRECLPEAHEREHISYPDLPDRRQGLLCPFPECGQEHATGDCNIDVTMTKIMESIGEVVVRYTSGAKSAQTLMEEVVRHDEIQNEPEYNSNKQRQHQLIGAHVIATYSLAAHGELDYRTDLNYLSSPEDTENNEAFEVSAIDDFLGAAQKEVECQVCYSLMLNPVTTYCGHTLCRICLIRVLDHTLHCPICRRALSIAPSLAKQPNNKTLVTLLGRSWPDLIAARAEAVAAEESDVNGQQVPLFVCTLGFPTQTTFLRIFEPRYRLMLRRCMEGSRQFGLLMYNRYNEAQGDLGNVHFYQYGTMLQIVSSQQMVHGESIVELRGLYRFRVLSHGLVDGYSVGNIERIDDVDLAEEERIEAEETSRPPVEGDDMAQQIDRMSTQDMVAFVKDFIVRNQLRSARFLQQHVLEAYGQPPDDAATFPWWFAAVVPLIDEEKYKLLSTRTVRERLKIVATWVLRIESQRWYYNTNSCRIL